MPTPFVSICPHCQTKLKLKNPDLIGKTARCPSCKEPFTVKKAGDVARKPQAAAAKPKPSAKPKPKAKPKPDPDEEVDPWLADDLGSYDQDDDWPPKSPEGGAAPPPVPGARKKKKTSSVGTGKKKRKKKSSVDAGQIAWVGWVVGGGVAGVIGAGVWGAIAAFTFSEWGILAWALGGFVGFGVRVGAREEDVGITPGMAALGIAIASVVLGKFLAVHFMLASIEKMLDVAPADGESVEMSREETVEWIISDYADAIAYEREEAGVEITWPETTVDEDNWTIKDDYSDELWAEAEKQWDAKTDQEQAAEIVAYESGEFDFGELEGGMFAANFGLLDLFWFCLASVTAFKVGSGLDFGDD